MSIEPVKLGRDGEVTLYCGDCLEVLPTLEAGCVDAVVTDVPYGVSQASGGLRELDYGEWDKWDTPRLALEVIELCRDIPTVVMFCGDKQLSHLLSALEKRSGRSTRTLVWTKPNPTVLNGQHLFLSAAELAAFGRLPKASFLGNCVRSVWHGTAPAERKHPTQKPLGLMLWVCRNVCRASRVAIDPFMGSGTTGVAAVKLGRRFIGIEKEPKYFDIACKRIQEAIDDEGLFRQDDG